MTKRNIALLAIGIIFALGLCVAFALSPSEQDKYDKLQKELDQTQSEWVQKENEQNILHAKAEYLKAQLLNGELEKPQASK
jgi:hypothetical protein